MTDGWEAFADMPDPRVERTRHHRLMDIISIAICAVICGADGWVAVKTFGKAKQSWLEQYLTLPQGIPSHNTFGRVFAVLDATHFQQHFLAWVHTVWPSDAGEVISVDGTMVRGSQ